MTKLELFILNWAGKILEIIGFVGVVFIAEFDYFARGLPIATWGWLQVCGIIFSISLALFGVIVDSFLKTVKKLLHDYLNS